MMDGRWVPRGGRERDEVRNDGVGLDGVCLVELWPTTDCGP